MICLEVMFLWKLRQSINRRPTHPTQPNPTQACLQDVTSWCIFSPYGIILIVFAHLLGRDPVVCNRLQHSKLSLLVGQCEAECITLQNRQPHGGTGASVRNMLHRWEKPLWHQIMGLNFYTLICCGKVNHRTGRCGQNTTPNTLSHWMSQKSPVETMLCPSVTASVTAGNTTYKAAALKWATRLCIWGARPQSGRFLVFCCLMTSPHILWRF